jgi:hypothetical protein
VPSILKLLVKQEILMTCFVLNFSGNHKKANLQILENFCTNSTKIKFVNFVGNYSYKVILRFVKSFSTSPENSIFLLVNKLKKTKK